MTPAQTWLGIGLALAAAIFFAVLLALIVPHDSAARVGKADKALTHADAKAIRTIPIAPQPTPQWAIPPRVATAMPPAPAAAPAATPMAAPAVPEDEPKPADELLPHRRHYGHVSGGDICERTGGHKVETHNGKSWRCRYARR